MAPESTPHGDAGSISVYLDDAVAPFAVYRPPARFVLDTTTIADGEHRLRIEAVDSAGNVGRRTVPFVVNNGPGITVIGLRAGAAVSGKVEIDVNAFSSSEPFDPVRAESQGPVPVWTWVMIAVIVGWAGWYGMEFLQTPPEFAKTPTYASNPAVAAADEPSTQRDAASGLSGKTVAGFDYAQLGSQTYGTNCASCHGAQGGGTPGVFPPLAGDPIVNGTNADAHVNIVLHGLSGKTIDGKTYPAQMPTFVHLTDAEIAAVIDHERTSWGNRGPLVTPEQVRRDRRD